MVYNRAYRIYFNFKVMANIIQFMKKAGFPSDSRGICFGLANTASMAYLLGTEQFNHFLDRMQKIHDLDINDDEAVEQLLHHQDWEIIPFLNAVEIYQNSTLHQYLYESIHSPSKTLRQQRVEHINRILQTPPLEELGGRHQIGAFTGLYTKDSLVLLLNDFKALCDQQDPPSKQTLMLSTSDHIMMIAYDPLKKQWLLHNHGDSYSAEAIDTASVVEEIIYFFVPDEKMPLDSNEHIALFTEFHSTGSQRQDAEKLFDDWQKTEVFRSIHQVSKEKAQIKDIAGISWLSMAVRDSNLALITELIDKGAEINASDVENSTPLSNACSYGSGDVVKYLLENGADPNIADSEGFIPLQNAIYMKNIHAIKEILIKYPENIFSLLRYKVIDYSQPSGQGDLSLDEFMMAHAFKTQNTSAFFCICTQIPPDKRFEKIEKAANSEEARIWMYTTAADVEFYYFVETSMQRLCEIMKNKPIDLSKSSMLGAANIGDEMLLHSFVHNRADLFKLTCKALKNQSLPEAISRVVNLYPPDQREVPMQWFTNALKQKEAISSPSQSASSFFAASQSQSNNDISSAAEKSDLSTVEIKNEPGSQ